LYKIEQGVKQVADGHIISHAEAKVPNSHCEPIAVLNCIEYKAFVGAQQCCALWCIASKREPLYAIAIKVDAIGIKVEMIAIKVEMIAIKVDAIAIKVEMIAI
jgi:hypothetical protein